MFELKGFVSAKDQDVKVLEELTKRVSIRKTHPNMYRFLMVIALMSTALAVNLYLTTPTFKPYGIEKEVIASIFLVLGFSQLVLLNLCHNLKLVRLTMAISIAFMLFWGGSNSQQAFAGKASFQLPILLVSLALLQLPLLIEPASNPMTSSS